MSQALFASTRISLLLDASSAGVLVFASLFAASWLRRKLRLKGVFLFTLVLLLTGLAAEATFFLTMIDTGAARLLARVVGLAGSIATILGLRSKWFRDELTEPDCWAPFAAMTAVGFAYLALFCIALPDRASSAAFAQIWLERLPNDNVLPALLAQHIADHAPAKPFIGGWLSSDRPPLQAGFELLLWAFTPAEDVDARYQALCMLLQATAFGMLFTLCRLCGCQRLRAGAVVLLSSPTGFFLINTEFVWPKLIAGAFFAAAAALCLAPGRLTYRRGVAAGAAIGLGLLTHGAVIFSLPVLVVALIAARGRETVRPLAVASAITITLYAPWIWYQKVYDPPGDRLLKWHLAGQIAPTNVPFGRTFYEAYFDVPRATIVANKISNLEMLLGLPLGNISRKDRQFFYTGDALSALLPCFVAAPLFYWSKRRRLRMASRLALIAVGSLLLWAVVLYLRNGAVVHVGSYFTMMLMFVAGGIVAAEWPAIFVVIALLQAYDFRHTWLFSLDFASVATPSGFVALLVLTTVAAACTSLSVRPVLAALRGNVILRRPFSRQPLSKRIEKKAIPIVASRWFPISVGVFVAVAMLATILFSRSATLGAKVPLVSTAAVAPVGVEAVSRLDGLSLKAGKATVSLDAVVINGKPIVTTGSAGRHSVSISATDAISFVGWAFDPAKGAPAAAVVVRIGTVDDRAAYGFYRPDVATAAGSRALTLVGFDAQIAGRGIPKGANPVWLIVVTNDGRSYYRTATDVIIYRR